MHSIHTKLEIKERIARWRQAGERVSVVPTMGALHPGHLSLVKRAKEKSDRVVVTIFVNPLQFGPGEDFDTYPREIEQDMARLEAEGCDVVFAPAHSELFAKDFSTNISVGGVGEGHCEVTRPQFFDGVATIVTKLLLILSPDLAIFGEKDFQQLTVIRRLVRDLDINVEIIGSPTMRETDGLAMSSRNAYLSAEERALAPLLYKTLNLAAEKIITKKADYVEVSEGAIAALLAAGFAKVDYFNIVDARTLLPIEQLDGPGRILVAAWMGKTRLIDNIAL